MTRDAGTDRPMLTYSEVWPLGADTTGIYLLSGTGPWPSDYISHQSDPMTMAEIELIQHGVTITPELPRHSTSWRIEYDRHADQNFGIYSFMVVVPIPELVYDRWPHARPIPPELADELGPAPAHPVGELPDVPYWFVLLHGLRHLRFLRDTDSDLRDKLDANWRQHLERFAPAIARMYQRLQADA
jgi:hypothetical protein